MATTKTRGRRTRNDPRKQITRQKIVDAARELILESGSGGLTKAQICERAGIDRSLIYAHFADVEDCVRAAAQEVADSLVARDALLRRETADSSQSGVERAIHLTLVYLRASLASPETALLGIRCRHELSPLGEVIREAMARGDALLAEDLWLSAVKLGLRAHKSEVFDMCARLITRTNSEAVSMLLDDPEQDVEAMAEFVGTWNYHAVQAHIGPLIRASQAQPEPGWAEGEQPSG